MVYAKPAPRTKALNFVIDSELLDGELVDKRHSSPQYLLQIK